MLLLSEQDNFKKLFNDYYAPFCIYAQYFIKEIAVCEDIVSDVFVTLWYKRNDIILKKETIIGYLKICVKNSCLNYIKHKKVERKYQEEIIKNININNNDNIYTLDELYFDVLKKLKSLSIEKQKVFISSYFKDKSQKDIAEELDISVKTVGRYKKEVLNFLKKEFKECLIVLLFIKILQI